MKVFLTGGGGMVGRNILECELAEKHEFIAPNRTELNLLDPAAVRQYVDLQRPDFIIHAAGHVGGIQSNMKDKASYLQLNLQMGLHVLQAAHQCGVERVMNLGSSCMYPRDSMGAIPEDKILTGELEPTNEGYAIAKIAVAKFAEYLSTEQGRKYKTIIPCNLYGRWDKFDPAHSHLIPAVISKVHQAKESRAAEVEIWGDGEARREFMYAGDLALYLLSLVEKFDDLPAYLNVGLGYDYSINDYYRAVTKVLGFEGKFSHDLNRPVGMKRKLVDVQQLKKTGLHYDSGLEHGIQKTYEFFQQKQG